MSDWEHVISERQFGNYTTSYDNGRSFMEGGPKSIRTTTKGGKVVGQLLWNHGEREDGQPHVSDVTVNKQQRRKGIASAMLDHARSIVPDLQHSHARTPDGRAWSAAKP